MKKKSLLLTFSVILLITLQNPLFVNAFTISGKITVQGDGSAANIPITVGGSSGTTTDVNGNYSVSNLPDGIYSVGVGEVTDLYNIVSGSDPTLITLGPDATVDYTLTPSFTSATGTVFNDSSNNNGIQDAGEAGVPNVLITYSRPFVPTTSTTTDFNGHYSLYVLNVGCGGTLKISTPDGFTNTTPISDNLDCSGIAGSGHNFGISTTQPKPPSNNGGNIINLNFGISNTFPWMQITCGDIRDDNGITDLLPQNMRALITDSTCDAPGISYTGDTDGNFGHGQNSSTNQGSGGSSYPEVFSLLQQLNTSYTSLLSKAQNADITPIDLATVCVLSNCSLPNNLPHGLYLANGDVNLNTVTFQNNNNYVFLINGNLDIRGDITIPNNPNASTALFSTSKNILVDASVGSAANIATENLDGWFIAGQNFIVGSQGTCNDLRLNIGGTVVVNALGGGGVFHNNRDLCGNDLTNPTISFTQRLDMILNAPQFLKNEQTISQELAP